MPQVVGTSRRGGGTLNNLLTALWGLGQDRTIPLLQLRGFGFLLLPVSQRARSQNKYCTIFLWKTQCISASYSSEQAIVAQGHTEGLVECQGGDTKPWMLSPDHWLWPHLNTEKQKTLYSAPGDGPKPQIHRQMKTEGVWPQGFGSSP